MRPWSHTDCIVGVHTLEMTKVRCRNNLNRVILAYICFNSSRHTLALVLRGGAGVEDTRVRLLPRFGEKTMFSSIRRFAVGATMLLAGVAVPALSAQASTWAIDPAHSGVEFSIKHLGVSTVRGSFSGVTGTVTWDEKNVGAWKV